MSWLVDHKRSMPQRMLKWFEFKVKSMTIIIVIIILKKSNEKFEGVQSILLHRAVWDALVPHVVCTDIDCIAN